MPGLQNYEIAKGTPARIFTKWLGEKGSFGYDAIGGVEMGGKFIPLRLEGHQKSLYLGQHVIIRSNSEGYIPRELKPGSDALVVGFSKPDNAISDELIQILGHDAMDLTPTSIKPSNIEDIPPEYKITGEPKIGTKMVNQTEFEYLFVPSPDGNDATILAINYKRDGKDTLISVGDKVMVNDKSQHHYEGVATKFKVGTNPIGSPEVLITLATMDGAIQKTRVVDYYEVANDERA